MSRRAFIQIATLLGVDLALLGCGMHGLKGELREPAKGFNPYNGINPNLKYYHHQKQTWLDNVIEHKVRWAGIQYRITSSEQIVAPANGTIWRTEIRKNGYHGLEDEVVMDHGGRIQTHFIHMKPGGSRPIQDLTRRDIVVKRGEPIGVCGKYFKIYMFRELIIGDMDHYGPHMGFMDYWDGKTDLDFTPEEVAQKNRTQIDLIYDLIMKYHGPGAAQLHDIHPYYKTPFVLVHNYSKKDVPWEHAMVFKLMKHIYDNQPGSFNGTKKENDNLIAEIYQNQPVILTLPFKKL